jgi:hypothetical protein
MTQIHVLRAAEPRDVPAIVGLIRELADFEQLSHLVQTTPEKLMPHLFGERPVAECLVAEVDGNVVAFALFFTNFSTFLCQPGCTWKTSMCSRPTAAGHRQGLAAAPGAAGGGTRLRPFRMERAGLERQRHRLLRAHGATVLPDWRICRVTGPALSALAA